MSVLLFAILGVTLSGGGALICTRAVGRLRRNRAFGATFWSSMPHFFPYRMRALRPLAQVLVGLALLAAGLVVLYLDMVSYYTARLGQPGIR
jgi:hypothetical protein